MINIDKSHLGVRWYVAHTYAGYENKVKASLEKIIENRGLEDKIFDVKIPAIMDVIDKNTQSYAPEIVFTCKYFADDKGDWRKTQEFATAEEAKAWIGSECAIASAGL